MVYLVVYYPQLGLRLSTVLFAVYLTGYCIFEIRQHPDGWLSVVICVLCLLGFLVVALIASSQMASCAQFDIYANIPLGGAVNIGPSVRVGREGVVGAGFFISFGDEAPTWTGFMLKPVLGCNEHG